MKRASFVLVGILVLFSAVFIRVSVGSALTISSTRDNDGNAVIMGGALNCSELQTHYSDSGVASIYTSFGISASDINNCANAVEGVVTNKNNVWIHRSSGLCPNVDQSTLSAQNQQAIQNNPNLCLVATNAMTAGRQNISGSTATSSNGVTFFMRPPSVSFVSSSLPAFVAMSGSKFSFAIIASCGNPVKATPVTPIATPKKTTTTTTPVRPTQTPTQTQSQSQTITVNNTTPAVQAATTTATASQPAAVTKTLPNTGPGNILALSGTTTAIGTIGHFIYSRRSRRSR